MVTTDMVYEAFRRFLVKQLRICDEDTVHVGEACNCLRKSYYTRKHGSKDLSHIAPSKRVILGLGMSTHLVFEEVLRELGYKTEQQVVREYDCFKLAGTPDAVGGDHIVEIKTCNKLPDEPLPHHVMQLNGYLGLLGFRKGYIVYICKRDGNVRIFQVGFNQRLFDRLVERARQLHEHLKSDTPPPPEPSFLCQYCEWKWKCYNSRQKQNYDDVKIQFKTYDNTR